MRRLSKLWTAVGSATFVVVGSALGGVGLVDFGSMLAIAILPQSIFLWCGQWPELAEPPLPEACEEELFFDGTERWDLLFASEETVPERRASAGVDYPFAALRMAIGTKKLVLH